MCFAGWGLGRYFGYEVGNLVDICMFLIVSGQHHLNLNVNVNGNFN